MPDTPQLKPFAARGVLIARHDNEPHTHRSGTCMPRQPRSRGGMLDVAPILPVLDMTASITFYEAAGFTVRKYDLVAVTSSSIATTRASSTSTSPTVLSIPPVTALAAISCRHRKNVDRVGPQRQRGKVGHRSLLVSM